MERVVERGQKSGLSANSQFFLVVGLTPALTLYWVRGKGKGKVKRRREKKEKGRVSKCGKPIQLLRSKAT